MLWMVKPWTGGRKKYSAATVESPVAKRPDNPPTHEASMIAGRTADRGP
jgi:hypothetical protein